MLKITLFSDKKPISDKKNPPPFLNAMRDCSDFESIYFKNQSTQASICLTEFGRSRISRLLSNRNMVGVPKT